MGIATFLIAFVPTYASIGIWGAVHLDRPAGAARYRRRRRMGRLGALGDGVGAHPRPARTGRVMAAIRRSLRTALVNLAVSAFSAWSGDQFLVWGWRIPFALSIILVGIGLWIRLGILETPVFQKLLDQRQDREGADPRSHQEAAEGNRPLGIGAAVRTGAVLYLYRLRLLVRGRHPAHVAEFHSHRGVGGGLASRSSASRSPATSPTASGAGRCT